LAVAAFVTGADLVAAADFLAGAVLVPAGDFFTAVNSTSLRDQPTTPGPASGRSGCTAADIDERVTLPCPVGDINPDDPG
jgi:hypothetical protein